MSEFSTRLTLFAIIDGLETDQRELTGAHLGFDRPARELMKQGHIDRALSHATGEVPPSNDPTIGELLEWLDLADPIEILNSHAADLPTSLRRHLKDAGPRIAKLGPVRKRVMHRRPLAYGDLALGLEVAETLVKSGKSYWPTLSYNMARLNDPDFLMSLSIPEEAVDVGNLPLPDYDETGFIGRSGEVADVIKLLKLPTYPVISVIGPGGSGKTALALYVAYELLDDAAKPFDQVVWTSSRVLELGVSRVVEAKDSICTSLGMLTCALEPLAPSGSKDPYSELLEYLREFKILLILDNVETVIDDRIGSLFMAMGETPSKLLVTSRIGLGQYECPYPLKPLGTKDAAGLLRTVAMRRSVTLLKQAPADHLAKYVERMHNNPGFIKWFVTVVQTGRSPEEVLADPDVFLDYCLRNVYEYLRGESRQVLAALQSVPGSRSLGEIVVLTELSAEATRSALQQLMNTSMITRESHGGETSFDLADLARDFLDQQHPVPEPAFLDFVQRHRRLIADTERERGKTSGNPYKRGAFAPTTRSEVSVLTFLRNALSLSMGEDKDLEAAKSNVDKARAITPDYFDVYRVDALVELKSGNFTKARASYQRAMDLKPDHAPLLWAFAVYLLDSCKDTEAALPLLKRANELDPGRVEVEAQLARAHLYLHEHEEAERVLSTARARPELELPSQRVLWDLSLQATRRKADDLASRGRYTEAVTELERLRDQYVECPGGLVDARMKRILTSALREADACLENLAGSPEAARAEEVRRWLARESRLEQPTPAKPSQDGRLSGAVKALKPVRGFGFTTGADGVDYFFHMTDMFDLQEWYELRVGDLVEFSARTDDQGRLRACDLTKVRRT